MGKVRRAEDRVIERGLYGFFTVALVLAVPMSVATARGAWAGWHDDEVAFQHQWETFTSYYPYFVVACVPVVFVAAPRILGERQAAGHHPD